MHVMIFMSLDGMLNALEKKYEFSMNCTMLHLNGHETDRHFQTNRFELAYDINPRILSFSTQRIDATYITPSSSSYLEN